MGSGTKQETLEQLASIYVRGHVATIEELEAGKLEKDAKAVDSDFVTDDESPIYADLVDAIELLKKAMCLLDYMSDTDLCKAVSKRERDAMLRLSDKITTFVIETENNYEDGA